MQDQMQVLETLGEGSFGTVHRVRVPGEQEDLACKVFQGEETSFLEDIEQEIYIMRILRAKATPRTPIVRMHTFHIASSPHDPQPSFITMDLCRGGSLLDLLNARTRLAEHAAAVVLATIAKGLTFCHQQARVLHLDVKPANILFCKKDCLDSARLADFGLSVQLIGSEDSMHTRPGAVIGTPAFLAPEARAHGRYSAAADTWSLGAVLFRMLMGHNPQPRQAGGFEVNFEQEGDAWKSLSGSAHNLMQGMLCPDPELRLTLPQVLCTPWVLLKGNTSMLDRVGATTIWPLPRMIHDKQLGASHHQQPAAPDHLRICPPGFEKVAMKRTMAGCLQSMTGSVINTSGIEGKQYMMIHGRASHQQPAADLRCPPGFEKKVGMERTMAGCLQSCMIGSDIDTSTIEDKRYMVHDKQLAGASHHQQPAADLRCPPGFEKVVMKRTMAGCLQSMIGSDINSTSAIEDKHMIHDRTSHRQTAADLRCPPGFEKKRTMAGCLQSMIGSDINSTSAIEDKHIAAANSLRRCPPGFLVPLQANGGSHEFKGSMNKGAGAPSHVIDQGQNAVRRAPLICPPAGLKAPMKASMAGSCLQTVMPSLVPSTQQCAMSTPVQGPPSPAPYYIWQVIKTRPGAACV